MRRQVLLLVATTLLTSCGTPRPRPVIAHDRFALGAQPDVYVIHHTAARTFAIQRRGDRGGVVTLAVAPAIAAVTNNYDAARLQQRFDLEDPALAVKTYVVEALRAELELDNLRVMPDPSNLAILVRGADALADEDRNKPQGKTFKDEHPTGAVIEIVTRYWGMEDYRIRYYATLRLVDLTASRVLFTSNCPWVREDPVNADKLFFDAGAGIGNDAYAQLQIYNERAEALLYKDNAALLKATLRRAAERCAATFVPRFLAPTRRRGGGSEG